MQIPGYLKVLWHFKWLMALGLAVAIMAAFLAGFTVRDGGLKSRAVQSYTVATTVLATSPNDVTFQAEVPSQEVKEGVTRPEPVDLSSSAVIYAYIVSGSEMRREVENTIGPLNDAESIMAVRRTTQPGGNERFPGSLRLPILDIVGVAETPERAREISAATTQQFLDYVVKQQDQRGLKEAYRVKLQIINESKPEAGETSNVGIPMVATAFAVLLAFMALAFALHALRKRRESDEQETLDGTLDVLTEPATGASEPFRGPEESDDNTAFPTQARRATGGEPPVATSAEPSVATSAPDHRDAESLRQFDEARPR